MAVLTQPVDARPAPSRPRSRGVLIAAVLAVVTVLALIVAVIGDDPESSAVIRGSGHSTTDVRETEPFTTVELAGTNTMTITVGQPRSVAVTADDNLVDHVTTNVRDGVLVVADRGTFTTKSPMTVAVSVPSLAAVTLSGEGTVTVEGVAGDDFAATLSGTGTLRVSGSAGRAEAVLADTGTLDLGGLVAEDAHARLEGTGTIFIHATSTLDARLTGTGSILYSGEPDVTVHNTGTGSITSR